MNFSQIFNEILPRASAFLGVFFVVMMVGYGFLTMIDFVPEEPKEAAVTNKETEIVETTSDIDSTEETPIAPATFGDPYPNAITIDALNRTVTVLNPNSRSIADLDEALLKGVVRHPDSADLNDQNGNMLILGHSSYLSNVFNRNFQAFNGIQNLSWGDTVRLRSGDMEYTYRVDRVYQAKASNVTIPTKSAEQKLTLATCNTFGAKEDRFIVEATLVSKKAL